MASESPKIDNSSHGGTGGQGGGANLTLNQNFYSNAGPPASSQLSGPGTPDSTPLLSQHNAHSNAGPPASSQLSAPVTQGDLAAHPESETYCDELLRQGRGFPLFVPQPQLNPPAEWRTRGIAIGDVGQVTPAGSFDFFFNIYLGADDPINANGVPEGFEPLPRENTFEVEPFIIEGGNFVGSRTVTHTGVDDFLVGDSISVVSSPLGAILALPHGAHQEQLLNLRRMELYAAEHAGSWYKYANITRGRGLVNGRLYLITGWEKAKSWGIAYFHDVSQQSEFKLSFGPTTDAANGYKYRWSGSQYRYKQADSPLDDGIPLNHTTFIHAFAISLGERVWEKLFGNGLGICEPLDWSTVQKNSGRHRTMGVVVLYRQGPHFRTSLGVVHPAGEDMPPASAPGDGIVTNAFPIVQIIHPSQIIHQRILREAPKANVVITHDDAWRDVFKEDGTRMTGQTVSELQQAIFDRFEIVEEDGAAFLRAKSNPAIYKALISCLKDACDPGIPGRSPRDAELHATLDGYLLSMASDNVVDGIVKSVEHLKTLLELSAELGLANDSKLRLALRRDEERIATLLMSIFTSKSLEEAVLRLEGDSAQCFLDVVQNTLDKGFFLAPEDAQMARHIIRKLTCSSDKLPSTLFITGITGKEEHPAFGGGFADIYRASYNNRTVALKYMRVSQYVRGSDSRNIRLKFSLEALVWKELCHPHILPFLGIEGNSFPSPLCMVSPWMEHGTVLNYLKQHGHSNVDKLLYEIAQGLQYLHSRNVVHGDLRGANILVNDDCSACLADFGLSTFSDATSLLTTNRGGMIYWMAPELVNPDGFGMRFARTPASDVYAFGCVCLELYTGRPPFSGIPEPVAMLKVINGERPPRPSSSPAMSDSLWNYVSTYWAQDPNIRPAMQVVAQNMIWPKSQLSASGMGTAQTPHVSRQNTTSPQAAVYSESGNYCSQPPPSQRATVMPTQIFIYEALISCLKDACDAGMHGQSPRDAQLHTTLDGYLLSMASDNVVDGIVKSAEHLKTLLELSAELGLANDSKLRLALHRDGERIANLLRSIFTSTSLEEAVLSLEGDSAQCFLDVVQNTLDKGFLLAPEDAQMARHIIRKLTCSSDELPSTLFITGITRKEEHPAFGGGFADIYRASYNNRTVALKSMRVIQDMRGSDSRNIRLKFCREALVWKELCHPHILPFLGIDGDSFPSPLCMVSPWMGHGTVLNYLEQYGHSNVDRLLYEIAQGLQYLHSRNVVHGDLRGTNILINDDWSACLADFGLSIFSDATFFITTNRRPSAYWMAPELLAPNRFGMRFARTPASDVYSFGCVCLELYTGRPPFSGILSEPGAMLKVVNGERPPRPLEFSSHVG
ncbi:Kinase-like protein [Mycena sanguinolenta]|uniref:Kinase-like protein n=1 Tax=Mycena sanguinolenta TaxID=230812 RepID=A0A8H6ZBA9_9AGAR|nr:Kinase-like protein [Mycena sanguinolenta]